MSQSIWVCPDCDTVNSVGAECIVCDHPEKGSVVAAVGTRHQAREKHLTS